MRRVRWEICWSIKDIYPEAFPHQIASGSGAGRPGCRKALPRFHPTSTVHLRGPQQSRLPGPGADAGGVVRPARDSGTAESASLLHPPLCPEEVVRKGPFSSCCACKSAASGVFQTAAPHRRLPPSPHTFIGSTGSWKVPFPSAQKASSACWCTT
jgi:hypothetical protein